MDQLPGATEEDKARFPQVMQDLVQWLQAEGKTSSSMVRQIRRNISALFEEDRKSIACMASSSYVDLVRVSPRNITLHGKRSGALRHLQAFWEQQQKGSSEGNGYHPVQESVTEPGGPGAATALEAPDRDGPRTAPNAVGDAPFPPGEVQPEKKRSMPQGDHPAKNPKKEKTQTDAGKQEKQPTYPPLASLSGVPEVLEQAKQLAAEGRLNGALCFVGRGASRKNASMNGIYVQREKPFHGQPSFKKDGEGGASDRFLFYSATKTAWKLSDRLDDNKTGFGFAKVEAVAEVRSHRAGAAPPKPKPQPSDLKRQLIWRVFDGKDEGYKKDRDVRCLTVLALLQTLAAESLVDAPGLEDYADSDGEQGSGSSSSCEQESEGSSEDDKGTVSSGSS